MGADRIQLWREVFDLTSILVLLIGLAALAAAMAS